MERIEQFIELNIFEGIMAMKSAISFYFI